MSNRPNIPDHATRLHRGSKNLHAQSMVRPPKYLGDLALRATGLPAGAPPIIFDDCCPVRAALEHRPELKDRLIAAIGELLRAGPKDWVSFLLWYEAVSGDMPRLLDALEQWNGRPRRAGGVRR